MGGKPDVFERGHALWGTAMGGSFPSLLIRVLAESYMNFLATEVRNLRRRKRPEITASVTLTSVSVSEDAAKKFSAGLRSTPSKLLKEDPLMMSNVERRS